MADNNSISFKTNAKSVGMRLLQSSPKLLKAIQTGMMVGMRLFEGVVVKEQMSGRSAEDVYLNRDSGTLARSWHPRRDFLGDGGFSVILGTNVKYAAIHQYGGITGKYGSVIPKRLFIFEQFKMDGPRIIFEEARQRMRKVLLSMGGRSGP